MAGVHLFANHLFATYSVLLMRRIMMFHAPQAYSLPGLEQLLDVDTAVALGRAWRWDGATEVEGGYQRLTACSPQGEVMLLGPNNEVSKGQGRRLGGLHARSAISGCTGHVEDAVWHVDSWDRQPGVVQCCVNVAVLLLAAGAVWQTQRAHVGR